MTRSTLRIDGEDDTSVHHTVGPVEAFVTALATHGIEVEVLSLHQTSVRKGASSEALTLLESRVGDEVIWSAGRDTSVLTATLDAVLRAAARGR